MNTMNTARDEQIAKLQEQFFQLLCEAPTMDVAAAQLADAYLRLMQRLMAHYNITSAPRAYARQRQKD